MKLMSLRLSHVRLETGPGGVRKVDISAMSVVAVGVVVLGIMALIGAVVLFILKDTAQGTAVLALVTAVLSFLGGHYSGERSARAIIDAISDTDAV